MALLWVSMSLQIASINSGSNGNCYYIGTANEAVLVDVGISCRETEKRMKRLGLSMEKVRAIFVSHEHTDHISGIPVLARKHRLPVYITADTLQNSRMDIEQDLVRSFHAGEPVTIGDLKIIGFPKFHDAADPHSFVVTNGLVNIGVFTDIGQCCDRVVRHFKECHAVFLEANYDEEMLAKGGYPVHLKKRISNGHGHLSNSEALELFLQHRPAFMSHLILSHLSNNNNRPELVEELFRPHARNTHIVVASRYEETATFHITSDGPAPVIREERQFVQLSLF